MNIRKKFILFVLVLVSFQITTAQEFSFGFKAGLTSTKNVGPFELNSNGESLEEISAKSAFILSLITNIRFTDEFSIQGELMYNQKSYNHHYNGPSYVFINTLADRHFLFSGNRDQTLNISNTFFQIPISLSYKFFNLIELQAGVFGNVLIQSRGTGEVIYSNIPEINGELSQLLNYNFNNDNPGQASLSVDQVTINNDVHSIPAQIGAYYDYESADKSFFNKIDAGFHFGLNVYINQSLFVGARYSMSMLDNTRNTMDRSFTGLDSNNKLQFNDDSDKYRSFEFTIGFSF